MYEGKNQRLLTRRQFARRVAASLGLVVLLVVVSLVGGMVGYVLTEHLSWTDAFVESAMLLGGMGPIHAPASQCGKIFAGSYALYCGLVFIAGTGLLLGPFLHRVMHRFHLDES